MSARREPSTPPEIPGLTPSRLLGMGGFADVFLYEQQMPRRPVAVKVLLAAHLSDAVRERFRTEADLMARLSHHPSIVTIHHAAVATDGRPYLVMEYCSRPSLGERYRNERMSVAEVLRIGVRLASAVETAHRAGILHRDIKPANILVTDFGWPALTDFGIAATTGLSAGAATGMSIPWAPPELLADEPDGDARADVWSLAATIYSLLAQRSPFEVVGGPNTAADLITRVERSPLVPVGRPDLPPSMHALLERAMAKDPADRHPSALALARALQHVEAELMLPLTPLDLPEEDDGAAGDRQGDVGGDATRIRPVQSVSPDAPPAAAGRPRVEVSPAALAVHAAARPAQPDADAPTATPRPGGPGPTGTGPATALDGVPLAWHASTPDVAPEPRRRSRVPLAVLAAVVVVAAGGGAVYLAFGGGTTPTGRPDPSPSATSTVAPVVAVPTPTELEGRPTGDGGVVFEWTNPDPQAGDTYAWGVVEPGRDPAVQIVDEPTVTVTPEEPEEVCVEVSIVRADRRFSTTPATGCASP